MSAPSKGFSSYVILGIWHIYTWLGLREHKMISYQQVSNVSRIETSNYDVFHLLDKNFHDAFANLHPHALFLEHVQKWQKFFLKKKALSMQFTQVIRRNVKVAFSWKV